MKNVLFILMLFCHHAMAQFKEIVIVDKTTGQPLEFVNVCYPDLNEGSITNQDGHVKMITRPNRLVISHLGYGQVDFLGEKIRDKDTVYLTPKVFELNEVVVSPFDIKKALLYVMDHYHGLYVDYPTLKECSFKETVKIDNQYKRLILAQIKWWSKNSAYQPDSEAEKFMKLWLGNTECSKIEPSIVGLNGNAYLKTKSLIQFLYLNARIGGLLHNSKNIEQTGRKTSEAEIIVYFETDWNHSGDTTVKYDGAITFDKETRAILDLTLNTQLEGYVKEDISDVDSIPYVTVTKRKTETLKFNKGEGNKLSLRYFDMELEGFFTIQGKNYDCILNNSVTVLKETKRGKAEGAPPIDLDKPIYKNFATNEVNSNSIVLSKDEQDFISNDD